MCQVKSALARSQGAEPHRAARSRERVSPTTMKRDRLGRFLSPGIARQRGGSGGGCGSGRTRGRPSRSGGTSADGAAAQLSWGSMTRSCGDTGDDGTDEAGGFQASSGPGASLVIMRANQASWFWRTRALWRTADRGPFLCRPDSSVSLLFSA